MKKLILFLVLFFFIFSSNIFAQDLSMDAPASSAGDIVLSVKSVEYTLPYPGLLPDSPLYFLKALRDRVVLLLISDPIKKASFDLLQADKRLNEGLLLFNKGKQSLAQSTISKGENYFEQGLSQLELAKKQGMSLDNLPQQFYLSSLKHKEVIKSLAEKSPKDLKAGFLSEEKRVENFKNKAKEVSLK